MDTWTRPGCDRRFGRRNQPHQCAPAMSLDECVSGTRARHVVDLLGPADVDADVRGWLTEASLGG